MDSCLAAGLGVGVGVGLGTGAFAPKTSPGTPITFISSRIGSHIQLIVVRYRIKKLLDCKLVMLSCLHNIKKWMQHKTSLS